MANVIIPPQHQSAPKSPVRPVELFKPPQQPSAEKPAWQTFDDEMDAGPCLQSTDPHVNKQVRMMMDAAKNEEKLSPQEEAHRQREKNMAAVKEYRWEGQERWQGRENEEMRLVRIYHPHTIIHMLQRAGIDARLEQHRNARLWLNEWSRVGRVGVNAWLPDEKLGRLEPTHVTTLQYPYGPEYSIMRFDDHGLPTNEKYRGWRSAMLDLVMKNVLREEEVERAFGPAIGPAGEYYREQLYHHRAIRLGVREA